MRSVMCRPCFLLLFIFFLGVNGLENNATSTSTFTPRTITSDLPTLPTSVSSAQLNDVNVTNIRPIALSFFRPPPQNDIGNDSIHAIPLTAFSRPITPSTVSPIFLRSLNDIAGGLKTAIQEKNDEEAKRNPFGERLMNERYSFLTCCNELAEVYPYLLYGDPKQCESRVSIVAYEQNAFNPNMTTVICCLREEHLKPEDGTYLTSHCVDIVVWNPDMDNYCPVKLRRLQTEHVQECMDCRDKMKKMVKVCGILNKFSFW